MKVVSAAVTALAAVGLGLALPAYVPSAAVAWIVVVAVLSGLVVVQAFRWERDPFAPQLVVGLIFAVLYVLRPAYVFVSGRYGPTRAIDDRALTPDILPAISHALALAALGLTCFWVGSMMDRWLNPGVGESWRGLRERVDRISFDSIPLRVGVVIAAVAAGYVDYRLVRDAGGLSRYISQLSVRSAFFFGRGYLAQITLPLKVLVLVVLAGKLAGRRPTRRDAVLVAGLLTPVLVGDFLTGGRATLLVGTLLPVVLLVHYLWAPLRLRVVATLVVAAMLVFVGSRIITRDSVYVSGQHESRVSLIKSAVLHLPSSTLGAREAVPFDSLVVLVDASRKGAPLLMGRTYLPIASFPVPRAIWPGKPLGGGNYWFTTTYFPGFYGNVHAETSISFLGELYANFGSGGIALGCCCLGFMLAVFRRRVFEGQSARALVVYAITIGYVVSGLRGDAFHTVTNWVMTIGLLLVIWPLVVRKGELKRDPVSYRISDHVREGFSA